MQGKEDMAISQMTSLKKFLCRNGDEAPLRDLTTSLSTLYARSMVAQGYLAVACDRLDVIKKCRSTKQFEEQMEFLWVNLSDALEEIQELSSLSGDLSDLLSEQ